MPNNTERRIVWDSSLGGYSSPLISAMDNADISQALPLWVLGYQMSIDSALLSSW